MMGLNTSSEFDFSSPEVILSPKQIYMPHSDVFIKPIEIIEIYALVAWVVSLESLDVLPILVSSVVLLKLLIILFSGLNDLLVDLFVLSQILSVNHLYKISIPLVVSSNSQF